MPGFLAARGAEPLRGGMPLGRFRDPPACHMRWAYRWQYGHGNNIDGRRSVCPRCEAAGENLSEWIAKACRQRLLSESLRDAVVWEQEHPVEAAAASAAEAAWQREIEAEQEVQYLTEQAWSESGGLEDGPTAEQRADAERRVHARTVGPSRPAEGR